VSRFLLVTGLNLLAQSIRQGKDIAGFVSRRLAT